MGPTLILSTGAGTEVQALPGRRLSEPYCPREIEGLILNSLNF